MKKGLNPSEAVYGLIAWLTTRKEVTTFSEKHDSAIAAEIAREFCETNDLPAITENWPRNLSTPKEPV